MRKVRKKSRPGRRSLYLQLRVHFLPGVRRRAGAYLPELRRRNGPAPAASPATLTPGRLSHANHRASHANHPASHANHPASHANHRASHANRPASHANHPASHANAGQPRQSPGQPRQTPGQPRQTPGQPRPWPSQPRRKTRQIGRNPPARPFPRRRWDISAGTWRKHSSPTVRISAREQRTPAGRKAMPRPVRVGASFPPKM